MEIKKQRNMGIDILRLIAMYGIVLIHALGDSALSAPHMSGCYIASWALYVPSLCAVNIYGLISGYVGVSSGTGFGRVMKLWGQVLFTSLTIGLIAWLAKPEVMTRGPVLNALFPINESTYWYMTAYIGLMFFRPFLNKALEHTDEREQKRFLLAVLVFFGALPLLFKAFPYDLGNGYSMIWLIILYLIGGSMARQKLPEKLSQKQSAMLFIFGIFLALGGKLGMEYLSLVRGGEAGMGDPYAAYTSPGMVLAAMGAMCFFAKAPIKGFWKELTKCFAPASLGVYLWHIHPLSWIYFISPHLPKAEAVGYRAALMLAPVSAGIIFISCLLIEKGRLTLFKSAKRLLKGHQ